MHIARSLLKLTRLDTSLLVALAVFIPLFTRTKDLSLSLGCAIPLLLIGMCTFIANDLDDIDKDRINHPERPLPSGHIKPPFAAALYFSLLAATLLATRLCIQGDTAFWYYSLLAFSISYGYIVDYFPGLKTLYVACATSIPVLIVANSYPGEKGLYLVTVAVFFFVVGRELCMDLVDRAGDTASFMHRINAKLLAIVAISSQAMGLLLLIVQVDSLPDALGILLIALLITLSAHYWFNRAKHKRAILLMKVELFAGLYFLL